MDEPPAYSQREAEPDDGGTHTAAAVPPPPHAMTDARPAGACPWQIMVPCAIAAFAALAPLPYAVLGGFMWLCSGSIRGAADMRGGMFYFGGWLVGAVVLLVLSIALSRGASWARWGFSVVLFAGLCLSPFVLVSTPLAGAGLVAADLALLAALWSRSAREYCSQT